MPAFRSLRRAAVIAPLAVAVLAGCATADEGLVAVRPDEAPATTDADTTDADTTDDRDGATTSDRADTDTTDSTDTTDNDAGATTTSGSDRTSTTDADASPTGAIDWARCPDNDEIECGTLDVPLDYDNPTGPTITLALQRALATGPDRIGSLLFNPGGPGVSTIDFDYVSVLPLVFDEALVERFDIVGWDPRGVGRSEPVDCVEDLDPYLNALDPTPDDDAEQAALDQSSQDLAAACQDASGDLLAHVSTQDTARDMDAIRVALGESTISYFGFSYGSELGAVYATLFPQSVRAMVIDGATNPSPDYGAEARESAVGIERALDRVLDDCAEDDDCAFHSDGDPFAAYDELFAELDANPLPGPDGRPPIGQAVMAWASIGALYNEADWEPFTEALADARDGDGAALLAAADNYWFRAADGTGDNTFEALNAINCVDGPAPPEGAGAQALAAEITALAPRTGGWWATQERCVGFPTVEPVAITGAGAGPILVLGNTGDPVTPIESTAAMARALEGGRLVTYQGEGHTVYIEAVTAGSDCVVDAVNTYFIDLVVPSEDIVCE